MPPQSRKKRKRSSQKGGFLNRYDFAKAERDTTNQAFKNLDKSAPALTQNLSGELNNILEQRIHQVITRSMLKRKKFASIKYIVDYENSIDNHYSFC